MTLEEFFRQNPKTALAFSGGVDSAYLLYAGVKFGEKITAYYVKTPFQPGFEWEDAKKLTRQLGVQMRTLEVDILTDAAVRENPPDRCYYCKKRILGAVIKAAEQDGYSVIMDGSNASDDWEDRPGMRALQELKVYSPLRLCGLTKEQIRLRSREAGLFTWDKPAYACLATRIPWGETITEEKLQKTEKAEQYLFSLGFRDFRVRIRGQEAKIQVKEDDLNLLMSHRQEIVSRIREDYRSVVLDLEVRK